MQKFQSKDGRIKMISFVKDKLIETTTSENHEIRLSRYTLRYPADKYSERDLLLIITRNNIYAEYETDFQFIQFTDISIDINPTWSTQSMRFDCWKINYHLELVSGDTVLVLSLWNVKEESRKHEGI